MGDTTHQRTLRTCSTTTEVCPSKSTDKKVRRATAVRQACGVRNLTTTRNTRTRRPVHCLGGALGGEWGKHPTTPGGRSNTTPALTKSTKLAMADGPVATCWLRSCLKCFLYMHSIRTGHVHGTAASSFITKLSVCTRVSQTKTLQAIKMLKTVPCAAADTASTVYGSWQYVEKWQRCIKTGLH